MLVYRTKIYTKIPSVNNAWLATNGKQLAPTKAFKKFKKEVTDKIYRDMEGRMMSQKRLIVIIKLGFSSYIKRDIDNYNKVILDTFKGIVFSDDSQIDVLINTKAHDVQDECFEIIIDDDIKTLFNLRNYISEDEVVQIEQYNQFLNKQDKKKEIVNPTPIKETLGRKLKALRNTKGWTTKQFAQKLLLDDDKIIIQYESDQRKPTKKIVKKIEELFDMTEGFIENMISR